LLALRKVSLQDYKEAKELPQKWLKAPAEWPGLTLDLWIEILKQLKEIENPSLFKIIRTIKKKIVIREVANDDINDDIKIKTFAVALRRLGIPVRIVYGTMAVRTPTGKSALAIYRWLEIFNPKTRRWIPVDPRRHWFKRPSIEKKGEELF